MIIGIHEYNRYIHEYPYLFMKFEDFMNSLVPNNHEYLGSDRLWHTCATIPVDCHPQRAPSLCKLVAPQDYKNSPPSLYIKPSTHNRLDIGPSREHHQTIKHSLYY
jgi:hypothetical protein